MNCLREVIKALPFVFAAFTIAASSAAAVDFTDEEKRTLYDGIIGLTLTQPENNWTPKVGDSVPDEIMLYPVPTSLKVIKAIRYKYAVEKNTVVLADPITREVVVTLKQKHAGQ